ncbi:hypothetical protein DFP72DRAFT_792630, partial [Ephemerocybe angulata]
IRAVAINEDNNDESLFYEMQKGIYRIVSASPECLLRSQQLFGVAFDEAHVIETWAKSFRTDYAELQTLRIVAGSEIPSVSPMATCSTTQRPSIEKK